MSPPGVWPKFAAYEARQCLSMSDEKTHCEAMPVSRERFSIAWRKPPIPQKRSIYLRAFAAARSEPFCIAVCLSERDGDFKRNRVATSDFVRKRVVVSRVVIMVERRV